MTPEQSRAARGWLGWSQTQLAEAASTVSTVKDFEGGRRRPIAATLGAMRAALEREGIAFVGGGGAAMGITFERATVDGDSHV